MNNIEILKDLEKYISFANKQCNFSNDADYKWHKELAGMIENLIQENKELKESLKIATAMLTKGTYPEVKEGDNDFSKQFIPKTKVKEKIEELEKERKRKDEEDTINPFYDQIDITHIIEVLQELLKEE